MSDIGRFPFPPRGALVAKAHIRGEKEHQKITGELRVYEANGGSVVEVDVAGLPGYMPAYGYDQPIGPFGFHIHEHGDCEPMAGNSPFGQAGGHFNPGGQPHGNHAGDLPVLMTSESGKAQMAVFTDKFTPGQVVGRTIMIHENPDDYRTSPAGNSGRRIACGVIEAV